MNSPCKDCKRRKIGCHDVEKCNAWREHVEAQRNRLKQMAEEKNSHMNWDEHLRRRKRGRLPMK